MKLKLASALTFAVALNISSCISNPNSTFIPNPTSPSTLRNQCAKLTRYFNFYSYDLSSRRLATTGFIALNCPGSSAHALYELALLSSTGPSDPAFGDPNQRIRVSLTHFRGYDTRTDPTAHDREIDFNIFSLSRLDRTRSLETLRRFFDLTSFDVSSSFTSPIVDHSSINPRALAVFETFGYLDDGREIPFITNASSNSWALLNIPPSLRVEVWNPSATSVFLINHLRLNPNPFFRALAAYRLGFNRDANASVALNDVSQRCRFDDPDHCIEPQIVRRAVGFAQSRIGGSSLTSLVDFSPFPRHDETSLLLSRAFAIGNSDFDMDFRELYRHLRSRYWPLTTIALVFALKYNQDKNPELYDLIRSTDLGARLVGSYVSVAVGAIHLWSRDTVDELTSYSAVSHEGMIHPILSLYSYVRDS